MAKIRVLNERIINKIAAGEVVERPASALKEMLENSFDAGAGELRIELEAGGKQLIRVIDDGEGMDADDILLALERHATSKIKSFEDLEEVASLGFRGEAIPSIAAVSKMTLRSRRKDQPEGREAIIDGGVIKRVSPVAMAPGTSVEVRALFFNVPARKKFLRSTATEYAHCQNVITHYALAFPEVTIRLRHNGREIIAAPPVESTRDRISALLGNNLLERMIPFEGREGPCSIMGYVSEPSLNRSDTSMLNFFVNRRAIRDRLLIHAVRAAYEDLLPKARTPVAFLFLEMPPRDVDVNVHPSKTEVRFKQSSLIHDLVVNSIRTALSGSKPLATASRSGEHRFRTSARIPSSSDEGEEASSRAMESLQKSLDKRGQTERIRFGEIHHSRANADNSNAIETTEAGSSVESLAQDDGVAPSDSFIQGRHVGQQQQPEHFGAAKINPESVLPLGQIKNSYIVALFDGGLLLIDQHAAHERILFEQLQRSTLSRPLHQMLLHPVIVDLPPTQARLVEENLEELSALGFDVEPFGPGSIALRSLPASLEINRAEEIFVLIASDLERVGKAVGKEKLIKELVVSASCHGAIKVNTPLSKQKMQWLLDSLFSCEMPMRCPHGRPVVLTIGEDELRYRFGRS